MHGNNKRKSTSDGSSETEIKRNKKEGTLPSRSNVYCRNQPTLKLSKAGRDAELTVAPALRLPLLLSDLRSQIHWACLRSYYDPYSLDWCSLTKKPSQTTVIIVEDVSVAVLEQLSLRCKKVRACREKLQQQPCCLTPLDESGERSEAPACRGGSQNDPSHLVAKDTVLDCSPTLSSNGCEIDAAPEGSLCSIVKTFLPNCCRHLDVRLEMVAPCKYGQTALDQLLLIRCPSATAASVKAGNMVPPRSLVHLKPDATPAQLQQSDECEWPVRSSACGSAAPPYEHVMRAWGISQSPHVLQVSSKWTKHKKEGTCDATEAPCDQFDRREMLLSVEQLLEMRFPVPACVTERPLSRNAPMLGDSDTPVATKDVYAKVTPSSPMFGVDCEFVRVGGGRTALGSIAVVNEGGRVVYHSLVKPDQPIVDYLTQWSGLTEEMMAPVVTSLADVQAKIRKHLPPDAILVGHSLENDLRVMKMHHPYIVDTSVLYNLSGSKNPSKLKTLSSHFLGKEIQPCSRQGHDAAEDATAALHLALLKLQHDMKFGNALLASRADVTLPEHNLFYSMFEYLEDWRRLHETTTSPSQPLRDHLLLLTTPRHQQQFGRALEGLRSSAALRVLGTNGEVVDAACTAAMMSDVSVLWLEADARLQSSKVKTRVAALQDLDASVGRIVHASPAGALIALVLAGSPSPATPTPSNGIYMAGIRAL